MILKVKDLYRVAESLIHDEETLKISRYGLNDLSGCAVSVLQRKCSNSKNFDSMFEDKGIFQLFLTGRNGRIYYYIKEKYDFDDGSLKPITDSVLRDWQLTDSATEYLISVL